LDSEIKELMEYIESSSFVEFELEREGFKLKLVRRSAVTDVQPTAVTESPPGPAAAAPRSGPVTPPAAMESSPNVHLIRSPIVGTFYCASSPGGKPFVELGDRVKKGQVLCIVEAMKLMNEIESDCDGEVMEILVSNGQPVEYGETLFKMKIAGPA